MLELIRQITITNYPDKVLISKARRPVYYVNSIAKIKGKTDIPKAFLNPLKYYFDQRGILVNRKTGEPQLANSKSAGKPRYWNVNFQEIWNGAVSRQARANKVGKLKDLLRPHVASVAPVESIYYPVYIDLVICDSEFTTDVSNKGVIYTKVIEDLLVEENKLDDDGPDFVMGSGGIRYEKVVKGDSREKSMIVSIYSMTPLQHSYESAH